MLKIGLTGGIGSGKTTVAGIFESLGIPVYYADIEAKRLMNMDPLIKKAILEAFGPKAYNRDLLDRKFLADKVFNNPVELKKLNNIVHPATIADADSWMGRQRSPYVIKEAALLIESNANQSLDYIIGIRSPEKLRISRTMKRDGLMEKQVVTRISFQMPEDEKLKQCDFIIENDDKNALIPQVMALNNKFMRVTFC